MHPININKYQIKNEIKNKSKTNTKQKFIVYL